MNGDEPELERLSQHSALIYVQASIRSLCLEQSLRAQFVRIYDKRGTGIRNPPHSMLLLAVVNTGCRTPVATIAVVAAVEPHIERIRCVCGGETRPSRIARPRAYSQRTEVDTPRNTSVAASGCCGALINKRTVLIACWPPRVVVRCE